MTRTFVAALAAACLIGFGACGSALAEPSVKSSKPKASQTTKPRGQSGGTTTDQGASAGGRGDSEYGPSGPKGR
jgi:hypothetical protein